MSNQKIRSLEREVKARDFLTNPTVAAELEETLLDRQDEIHKRIDEELRVVMRSPEVAALVRRMFMNCIETSAKLVVENPKFIEKVQAFAQAHIEAQFEALISLKVREAMEEKLKRILVDMRLNK